MKTIEYTVHTIYTVRMPQKTFYLRVEDEALWAQVKDKAQLVHDALRSVDVSKYNRTTNERKEIKQLVTRAQERVYEFCKHDQVKGLCKKGCK